MSLHAQLRVRIDSFELDATLDVQANEVVALLGPNGAGKTTLLRALAGLLPLDHGRVVLDGRTLEDTEKGVRLSAEKRRIGVVFQDYLLFPHLNARDNVAFGLRARGMSKHEALRRADSWLERFDAGAYARVRPGRLSGGQAQRVALARALACEPQLLALDEPLRSLDVATRHAIRHSLREHLDVYHGPSLLITHDPIEAITLADRLVVLEDGRVTQTGTIDEVARRPRSAWVARLVGVNLYRGDAHAGTVRLDGAALSVAETTEGSVFVLIRPQAVSLHRAQPAGSPRNVWQGTIAGIEPFGDRVRVSVRGPLDTVAEVTPAAVRDLALTAESDVWVAVKAAEIELYPA
jgi:molybdate transport system ATP-binding protein